MKAVLILLGAICAVNAISIIGGGLPPGVSVNTIPNTQSECGYNLSTIYFVPIQSEASYYLENSIKWQTDGVNANNNDDVDLDLLVATGWDGAGHITGVTLGSVEPLYTNLDFGDGNVANNANGLWVRVPEGKSGWYVIRFKYNGFFSCVLLNVSTPANPLRSSATASNSDLNVVVGTDLYYQAPMMPNNYVVRASLMGPIVTPISMYVSYLPRTITSAPNIMAGPGQSVATLTTASALAADQAIYTGVCADGLTANVNANRQITYRFTVSLPADLDTGATWEARLEQFTQGILTVGAGEQSIQFPHGDYLYFITAAKSSEADGAVRIVLTVPTGAALPTEFSGASNCAFSTNTFTSKAGGENQLCLDVPTTVGTKYVKVSAMTSSYTLITEKGKCSELSSASSVAISAVFVILALILAMF